MSHQAEFERWTARWGGRLPDTDPPKGLFLQSMEGQIRTQAGYWKQSPESAALLQDTYIDFVDSSWLNANAIAAMPYELVAIHAGLPVILHCFFNALLSHPEIHALVEERVEWWKRKKSRSG